MGAAAPIGLRLNGAMDSTLAVRLLQDADAERLTGLPYASYARAQVAV